MYLCKWHQTKSEEGESATLGARPNLHRYHLLVIPPTGIKFGETPTTCKFGQILTDPNFGQILTDTVWSNLTDTNFAQTLTDIMFDQIFAD